MERATRGECKGASGKTSGRSIFRNAPLRATSSTKRRSRLAAISKALPTCINRTFEKVGFARHRKTLLFWIPSARRHIQRPQPQNSSFCVIPTELRHLVFLRHESSVGVSFLEEARRVVGAALALLLAQLATSIELRRWLSKDDDCPPEVFFLTRFSAFATINCSRCACSNSTVRKPKNTETC